MSAQGKCLQCGSSFTRKHPSQRFCPKNKSGRHLCKDKYHNQRRFVCGEITPARAAHINAKNKQSSHEDIMSDAFPFGSEADIGGW